MTNRNKSKLKLATYSLALALCFPKMTTNSSTRNGVEEINSIECSNYNIDELGNYVLQGVCVVDSNLYITAYDGSKDKKNSKIFILNENKEIIKEVEVYNNSHVGGICYDEKHNIVWITDKQGCISGYNKEDIENATEPVNPIYKKIKVSNNFLNIYGNNAVAYIAYHDEMIYVGNYNAKEFSKLKAFKIMDNGCIEIDSVQEIDFVDYVQGITFYEANDQEYILVSSSYGPFSKSTLKIFKYNEETTNYNEERYTVCKMPRMMEQITTCEDKLIAVYESNAKKYKIYGPSGNDLSVYDLEPLKRKL